MAKAARRNPAGTGRGARSSGKGGGALATGAGAPATAGAAARALTPDELWARIAKKAYELYERRGRGDGRALEDWLEAEALVMQELHAPRE
ncbi:DUF2934 domain-containing protein [Nitrospira sp. Kam-Ns4a]